MSLNGTMLGVLWEGVPQQMTLAHLPIPTLQSATDAIVRVTAAAICGTDLHIYHGIYGSPDVPWGMGHEAVGYITQLGADVDYLSVGDYVIIPDNLSHAHLALTPDSTLSGGLGSSYGSTSGYQAEYVQVPNADASLIPFSIPANASASDPTDIDYLMVSDILATGWAALDYAGFQAGETVAVFGGGPVGLLSAHSALIRGASRVYVVDHVQARLDKAAEIGAVPINFVDSDPVQQILSHEPNGVTRSVDCVGYEALNRALEVQQDIIINQMVAVTAQQGGIGQVGVASASEDSPGTPRGATMSPNVTFPLSEFFNKGLRFQAGGVDPKELAAQLVELIAAGKARPSVVVSSEIGMEDVLEYYERFDRREETKVVIRFP